MKSTLNLNLRVDFVGSLYLLLATFFWGSTFLVQRTASLYIDAFLFNGTRFFIAGALFLIIISLRKYSYSKQTISHGCFSGLLIMLAINLQQLGVERTSAGKAGVITSLYILFVPLILTLKGKKIVFKEIAYLVISLFGFILLSGEKDIDIKLGDILVFIAAMVFAYQVYYVGEHAYKHNTLVFSSYQYLACGISSLIFTPFITVNFFDAIAFTWFEISYACIFSVLLGYTLQIAGQKRVPTTIAALLMSLEGPIAMILGFLILKEAHSSTQYIGATIITLAAIFATTTRHQNSCKTNHLT